MRKLGTATMSAPPGKAALTLLLVLAASSSAQADDSASDAAPPVAAERVAGESIAQRAAPESCSAERFVILRTSPELDAALMAEVRTDLATELEQRGIAVCAPESTTRGPEVIVDVRPLGSALVIELDDRMTQKRVARDLSLQTIPANGRALAVAIAIDELLRASWAELSLKRHDEAREDDAGYADDDASVTLQETLPVSARGKGVARRRLFELGASVGYAHTKESFDAFSVSIRAALHPWERGWLELRLSGLGSLAASSERGDVIARGAGGSLSAGLCAPAPQRSRVFGCGGARSELSWLMFRGVRPELAKAREQDSLIVSLSAVALLALRLSQRVSLFAELAPGAVVRGAQATDRTRTLLGVTGFLLSAQLGFGVQL